MDDNLGEKYGRLTVVEFVDRKHSSDRYKFLCECGNEKICYLANVKRGTTKSCGCLLKERAIKRMTKHGESKTRLYKIYTGMQSRCYREYTKSYKSYGAKGITICDEWNESFLKFKEWALNNGYQEDLSIERVDPSGNYEPSNCKWIARKLQNDNKKNTIFIEHDGRKHSMRKMCRDKGIKYTTVYEYAKRNKVLYQFAFDKFLLEKLMNEKMA